MRTFVLHSSDDADAHGLFWNIRLNGAGIVITSGNQGGDGQTRTKSFANEQHARRALNKLVAQRLREGYVETTMGSQQVLDRALVADPDDLVANLAYADCLMEQGDPRGEFIRVQVLLEEPGRCADERAQLRKQERHLLTRHADGWLGDAGRFLDGDWSGLNMPYYYEFVRGWLDHVRVLPTPDAVIGAIAYSPEFRLLRRLEIVYDMDYQRSMGKFTARLRKRMTSNERQQSKQGAQPLILEPLLESPYLGNLRVFKLGFGDDRRDSMPMETFANCDARQVVQLLGQCPRLEQLYLNTHLDHIQDLFAAPELGNIRVLQYFNGSNYFLNNNQPPDYPLAALADNAALKNLTTLRLRPAATMDLQLIEPLLRSPHLPSLTHLQVNRTAFSDEACQAIVDSNCLRRLKILDLAHGNMTDEGARLLASCPDLAHLKSINVSHNAMTRAGVDALSRPGIQVIAESCNQPHRPEEQIGQDDDDADDDYEDDDYDGDME